MRAYQIPLYPLVRIDWLLIIFVAALSALGVVALISATSVDALIERQKLYLYAGLALMIVCACIPWSYWRWLSVPAYLGTVLLLVMVYLWGTEANNARRWLDLGVFSLQPSELAKVTTPLAIAFFYAIFPRRRFWHHVFALMLLAIPVTLVFVQPDLGTSVMIAAAGLLVVFFAGLSWYLIGGGTLLSILAAPVVWSYFFKDYQKERILSVFDPYSDPLGSGYHTIQSAIAVGSGGMSGKGWGQGTQSQLGFLPEKHTDFIFAVFAEEFGFIGSIILLGLIMLVFLKLLTICVRTKDLAASYAVAAFAFLFLMQGLINLAMVSGVLPVVGLPLPLVSYGGTSLLAFAVMFGIAMSARCFAPNQREFI